MRSCLRLKKSRAMPSFALLTSLLSELRELLVLSNADEVFIQEVLWFKESLLHAVVSRQQAFNLDSFGIRGGYTFLVAIGRASFLDEATSDLCWQLDVAFLESWKKGLLQYFESFLPLYGAWQEWKVCFSWVAEPRQEILPPKLCLMLVAEITRVLGKTLILVVPLRYVKTEKVKRPGSKMLWIIWKS